VEDGEAVWLDIIEKGTSIIGLTDLATSQVELSSRGWYILSGEKGLPQNSSGLALGTYRFLYPAQTLMFSTNAI
jgi:hypothetical protein